jgi:hypothetical protein
MEETAGSVCYVVGWRSLGGNTPIGFRYPKVCREKIPLGLILTDKNHHYKIVIRLILADRLSIRLILSGQSDFAFYALLKESNAVGLLSL